MSIRAGAMACARRKPRGPGTLGILIPPSINLTLYRQLTDSSVPELYLAGFLPGILLPAWS